ncbi:hypothetical protein JTB14_016067 [Gonioctena quinquepunctata]|nr:hypothetical protein JTB14_016067 [Gonioctena quinquepunctata]
MSKERQVRKNAKVSDSMRGFLLNPIVEVCFKKGKRSLDYKTDFEEEFISLDFLKKKFNFQSIPEVLPVRGILTSKKHETIKVLGPLMPINRLNFWKNLHEIDSAPDLVEEYDNNVVDSMW